MEFTSLLNGNDITSLDLNIKPIRFLDEGHPHPSLKQEMESSFTIGLGRNVNVEEMRVKEERGELIKELKRVNVENKKLTELLTVMCENYNELRNRVMIEQQQQKASRNSPVNVMESNTRKRKAEDNNINNIPDVINTATGPPECSSSDEDSSKKLREEQIKAKISKVCVRTEASDTSLIVKDGYQWRKYGQKVTRDNPCPRAYFKCSFAPACPVKKKVQRSIDDQSIVVATYEGEHNHPNPLKTETTSSNGSNRNLTLGPVPCPTGFSPLGPTITLDLTNKPKPSQEEARAKLDTPELQQYIVEQMATTLTQDPNFKAALAAAISGKFMQQQNQKEKW